MRFPLANPAALTAIWIAFSTWTAPAQVTFKGFGVPNAWISDMSADGSVIVGTYVAGPKSSTAFRWTQSGGLEDIGGLMGGVSISRDGKTIVGSALDSQNVINAAVWVGGSNWRVLGKLPDAVTGPGIGDYLRVSSASGVSADGSVIVGFSNLPKSVTHGFRWDANSGMVDLGALIDGESSYALGVSGNGKAIVGWTEDRGIGTHVSNGRAGWIHMNGVGRFIHPYGWAGQAHATNDVGSTIVGKFFPYSTTSATTWRWSAWNGLLEDLGAVPVLAPGDPTEYQSEPSALSDTGDVIVGNTGNNLRLASIWTAATGMMTIDGYLTTKGVTGQKGWHLQEALYCSPDGKRIAGTGFNPQGLAEAWIVTLP